jgi:hypothetical protein
MTGTFDVGDLVRDKLNEGQGNYGLGVIVAIDVDHPMEQYITRSEPEVSGNRYDVYFNKFERTITFHGDYLEKV